MSDGSGSVVPNSLTRYYPFGGYRTGGQSDLTDRGFTGQKENMELGLYYYNARYYLPGVGRFISADSLVPEPGRPQSFNRYSYGYNNPVKYSDPTGHCATDPYDEYYDYECWQQYDAVYDLFRSNDYTEETIMNWIGTGESYEYHSNLRTIDIYDRYRNCGSDFTCSVEDGPTHNSYVPPCQYWQSCWEPEPVFDFVSLNLSTGPGAGPTVSITKDKYGNVYATFGGQVGTPGFSASITGGDVTNEYYTLLNVTERDLQETLTGFSQGAGGGAGPGIAYTFGPGPGPDPVTLQVGIFTPQLSAVPFSWSMLLYDKGSPQPWFWQK